MLDLTNVHFVVGKLEDRIRDVFYDHVGPEDEVVAVRSARIAVAAALVLAIARRSICLLLRFWRSSNRNVYCVVAIMSAIAVMGMSE